MMKKIYLFILLITALVSINSVKAEPNLGSGNLWFNLTAGAGTGDYYYQMLGVAITGSYQFNNYLYATVRGLAGSDFKPNYETNEIAGLIGVITRNNFSMASFGAGLSRVYVYRAPDVRGVTLGIPLEGQAFIYYGNIGFGVYTYADINRKNWYWGAMFGLMLRFD